MTENESDPQAAGELQKSVDRWAAKMVSALARDGEDAATTLQWVIALSNEAKRGDLAIDLLYSLAPEAADPDLWMRWINGGSSPRHRLRTQQFDAGTANSGRKIQAALTDVTSSTEKSSEARLRLEKARDEMRAAERALERAEQEEKRTRDIARGVTAWAYLNEVATVATSVFAMGPAWSLMRVVSGHLQEDPEWEKGLPEDQRIVLAKHRDKRQERSQEMLRILHKMSGNTAFEVNLFERLYEWLKPYAETASDRAVSSSRSLKAGVGRRAKKDDADEVARGVSR